MTDKDNDKDDGGGGRESPAEAAMRLASTRFAGVAAALAANPRLADALIARPDVIEKLAVRPDLIDTVIVTPGGGDDKGDAGDAGGTGGPDAEGGRTDTVIRRVEPARGLPAKLSNSEVARLAEGVVERGLAVRLASQPMVKVARPDTAVAARFSPVTIEAGELELVADLKLTREPVGFLKALDRAALTDDRFGVIRDAFDTAKATPRLEPEG
ncbi:MAG: hypothetical protein AAFV86_12455 [Pseudomonadota bacterium]